MLWASLASDLVGRFLNIPSIISSRKNSSARKIRRRAAFGSSYKKNENISAAQFHSPNLSTSISHLLSTFRFAEIFIAFGCLLLLLSEVESFQAFVKADTLHLSTYLSTSLPVLGRIWTFINMPVLKNDATGFDPRRRHGSMGTPPLVAKAQEIAGLFEYPTEEVLRGVTEFLKEIDDGLAKENSILSQIPSYVTGVPKGDEKGLYLAVDLGGTNFRACSVYLHGDGNFTMRQSKTKIPSELMVTKDHRDLFNFMAEQIDKFIQEHLTEHWSSHLEKKRKEREKYVDEEYFDLGFTFSFPVDQSAINKGTLIRWTKGFDIEDAIGRDVCEMLQNALNERHLPVRVAALVNDTVGTLMARAYTSRAGDKSLLGAIFGTGTNGAYVEKMSNIKKLAETSDQSTGDMIINCEWGSFDNPLKVLPTTKWDIALNEDTHNKNYHMFEKRVSGMFLGEIVRRVMLDMTKDKEAPLFSDSVIPEDSILYKIWGIDTSFLSVVEADDSVDLKAIANHLIQTLGIDAPTFQDCEAVQILCKSVGLRSARLAAVAISSIIIWSGRLKEHTAIDVGVDGSLVEFYPHYEEMIRETMHEIPEVGLEGEQKITIGIAKDGSGVGAALGAVVATRARK